MIRDALQPKHLVKPEAQKNLQNGFLRASRGFGGNQPIKRRVPAHHSERELLNQTPVSRGKGLVSELIFEDFFDKLPLRGVPFEHGHGNFSWFLAAHSLIITVAQLQARTYGKI